MKPLRSMPTHFCYVCAMSVKSSAHLTNRPEENAKMQFLLKGTCNRLMHREAITFIAQIQLKLISNYIYTSICYPIDSTNPQLTPNGPQYILHEPTTCKFFIMSTEFDKNISD